MQTGENKQKQGGESEDPPVYIPPGDALPQVTARSAVVMEALTGEVLYQRMMDERRYPASTTKIMSLITALESNKGSLDDAVKISGTAADMEGSTMWLERGERYRLEDLLYGMMLVSGNDAATAVAEHVAGSVPAFAKRMTEKAHEIGASHTRFV
ncbi:MAG: D-alanyl-D-alanine carboxypeptidase, partial [Schwartzia sp.]|nr:D-alanyl-D-alanine carboxypeptidase [Schwartzia sp. (in: firmicutes)]